LLGEADADVETGDCIFYFKFGQPIIWNLALLHKKLTV